MRLTKLACTLGALFAIFALACSDSTDPDDPGGGGGTGGSNGGSGGVGGSGEEPVLPEDGPDTGWEPEVPASLYEPIDAEPRPASCGAEFGYVAKVRGWIVAPGGQPLKNAFAQFCIYSSTDSYVCLSPATSDENGIYTVEVPEAFRCVKEVAMRTLAAVEHPKANRAIVYCPVTTGDDPVVRLEDPSVLPLIVRTEDLPPVGNEDEAREVVLADGLTLQVTPSAFSFGVGKYEELSARFVPADAVGLCGDAPTFDGLYALHPEDQIEGSGFPFSIENTTGLPAGARVEFFVLGGLDCKLADGTKLAEGEWARFGEGEVSADGTSIHTDEGVGLPCTTWLAYRLKE